MNAIEENFIIEEHYFDKVNFLKDIFPKIKNIPHATVLMELSILAQEGKIFDEDFPKFGADDTPLAEGNFHLKSHYFVSIPDTEAKINVSVGTLKRVNTIKTKTSSHQVALQVLSSFKNLFERYPEEQVPASVLKNFQISNI